MLLIIWAILIIGIIAFIRSATIGNNIEETL